MNIAKAAAMSGLPAKTVRYYDDIGLVTPGRRGNGYRAYDEKAVQKLAFLKRARQLGFSVEECRQLLSLYEDKGRASADVRDIATRHLLEIDQRLKELTHLRDTLAHLVDCCHGDSRPDCPILKDLAGPESAAT